MRFVKQLLAFILLLSHVNTSMFFPVVEERDLYDKQGVQIDDVNSVVEYMLQGVMGHQQNTPDDEDDDQPHFFHLNKLQNCICFNSFEVKLHSLPQLSSTEYPSFGYRILPAAAEDLLSPPPESFGVFVS